MTLYWQSYFALQISIWWGRGALYEASGSISPGAALILMWFSLSVTVWALVSVVALRSLVCHYSKSQLTTCEDKAFESIERRWALQNSAVGLKDNILRPFSQLCVPLSYFANPFNLQIWFVFIERRELLVELLSVKSQECRRVKCSHITRAPGVGIMLGGLQNICWVEHEIKLDMIKYIMI